MKSVYAETFDEYSIDFLLRNYNAVAIGSKNNNQITEYKKYIQGTNKGDIKNLNFEGAVLARGNYPNKINNNIDFDKLYAAYEVMYDDAIQLARDGICIYDLPYNIVFDGERLFGIDTCGYYHAPVMDCLNNPKYIFHHIVKLLCYKKIIRLMSEKYSGNQAHHRFASFKNIVYLCLRYLLF